MAGPKVQQSASSGPVVKRQKRRDSEKHVASQIRQSKIFAPFRVSFHSATKHLRTTDDMTDRWPCFAYKCSLHSAPTRQDDLPDHYLGRPLSPNVRPQARTQSRLHNSTPNPRGDYCNSSMEQGRLCSLVKLQERRRVRRVGIPAREKD